MTIDLEERVVVDADVPCCIVCLSNLLDNELTHLPVGCQVSVRLNSHHGPAELVIEDNGPGFPPGIGSRAFERFVKGKTLPDMGLDLPLWMPLPRRMAALQGSPTVREAALS